jgi:signal transduction histidine kinase
MNLRLPSINHPFRVLLQIEWILIGMAVFNDLPVNNTPFLETLEPPTSSLKLVPYASLLTIFFMVILGLMGLRLPVKSKLAYKWLYTALELGLIWLVVALGAWQTQYLSLHLIVIIRSCLIFKQKGRFLMTGLLFISFILMTWISFRDINTIQAFLAGYGKIESAKFQFVMTFWAINGIFLFGLVVLFILMLVNALLSERQSRQQLAIAHDRLRQYFLLIEDRAALQERNRIAREIHDSLGHALTAQRIQIENALHFCLIDPEKTLTFLKEIEKLTTAALKDVRQSISTLRCDPVNNLPLEKKILQLSEDFRRLHQIFLDCQIALPSPVSNEVSNTVYRIIQEALTNIAKHSRCDRVVVRLNTDNQCLHLLIEDNGKGFNPQQNTTGFGLQGMRDRTSALGGKFHLISNPGEGCQIIVDVPLRSSLDDRFTFQFNKY